MYRNTFFFLRNLRQSQSPASYIYKTLKARDGGWPTAPGRPPGRREGGCREPLDGAKLRHCFKKLRIWTKNNLHIYIYICTPADLY